VSKRNTSVALPDGQVHLFTQGQEATSLGDVASLDYPCRAEIGVAGWTCVTGEPQRTVSYAYDLGRISAIPGVVDSVTYHPNGLVDTLAWTGGGALQWTLDNDMARPRTIGLVGVPWLHYKYDGAGNVLQELDEGWAYDGAGRVVFADYGVRGEGGFDYDGFGNRISRTPPAPPGQGVPIAEPVSTASNRLNGPGVAYDAAGNLIDAGNHPQDPVFTWDALNALTSVSAGGLETRELVYTADGERLLALEPDGQGGIRQVWRLRGLDGKVLREYTGVAGCSAPNEVTVSNQTLFDDTIQACQEIVAGPSVTVAVFGDVLFEAPTVVLAGGFKVSSGAFRFRVRSALPVDAGAIDWTRDFVYRDGTLVTTFEADGEVLKPILNLRGDPRAHLDANGAVIANGGYYLGPFGIQYSPTPESVDPNADPVKAVHRFTGHERDVNQVSNALDDLDYMHARYMMPRLGRFLSVDPVPRMSHSIQRPQLWNRYAYGGNGPQTYVDPTGEFIELPTCSREGDCRELNLIKHTLSAAGASEVAAQIRLGGDGRIAMLDSSLEASSNFTVRTLARAINSSVGLRLRFVSGGLTGSFGARTGMFSGHLETQIDPRVASRAAVHVRTTGELGGIELFRVLPMDEVLMHELGHFFAASGIMSSAVSFGSTTSISRALEYENRHREQKGPPRSFYERISHDRAVLLPPAKEE
jgi:RHS repeat-associated protein